VTRPLTDDDFVVERDIHVKIVAGLTTSMIDIVKQDFLKRECREA
jgi:hypothetical protein